MATKSETRKKKKEEEVAEATASPQQKSAVLDFFNRCDIITLNRLLMFRLKGCTSLIHNIIPENIIRDKLFTKGCKRFENIEALYQTTHFDDSDVVKLAKFISEFKKKEQNSVLIKSMVPEFEDAAENQSINKVVCIDLYMNEIAWTEQDVDRREITDCGSERLFEGQVPKYCHISNATTLQRVMQSIPSAPVYLFHSQTANYPETKSFDVAKYQTIQEATFMSHLCLKASQFSQRPLDKSVYMFKKSTLHEFYTIKFGQQFVPLHPLLKSWYKLEESPLDGLQMLPRIEQAVLSKENEMFAICILMSDIFSRCLRRRAFSFPRYFSVHDTGTVDAE
ncbi:hypothetical protein DPMN_030922 [Dreissena polymorpha]|uniref:Uncharacterized protein n=2 Tax=Dreissena polymorpha TaxID=45954 RepID=A0A9D4LZ09_DREPO|nr:hypothetical protein DPMN_030922 [Dreissena polymorpha]